MSSLDNIYLRLPAWAQNFALDLKGVSESRNRFTGDYPAFRRDASRLRNATAREVELEAFTRLGPILETAFSGTSFYKSHWGAKYAPSVSSWEELRQLPVLEKTLARRRNEDLRSRTLETPLTLQTTGTTGTPLRIYATRTSRQLNYAFFDDFLAAAGIEPRSKRVVIGGRLVVPQTERRTPWRVSRTMKTMYLSSYHIEEKNVRAIVRALNEYGPSYLEAYPSAVSNLARLARAVGVTLDKPLPVVTSAETLLPSQEQEIRSFTGAAVHDQYGCAEMAIFAERCSSGNYHVRTDYALVEVLGENGTPAGPGEAGRIVCTGLVNLGMPLIRYAIGDQAEIAQEPCTCGWDTPVWTRVLGRMDDVILTPDGRSIGRLSPILKGFPIIEGQFVQEKVDELSVRVVPSDAFKPTTIDEITRAVELRIGDGVRITVDVVESIPRGPGGKFRAVISRIGNDKLTQE